MQKIALISLNNPGYEAAQALVTDLKTVNPQFKITIFHKCPDIHSPEEDTELYEFLNLDEIIENVWKNYDAQIWFAATGIVVRKIAPLMQSKIIDPAILVMNINRTQIIPLLSGHIGRANELAIAISKVNSNITPFITTATDTLGLFAFDLYAQKKGYKILNPAKIPEITNKIINNENIMVVTYPIIQEELIKSGIDPQKVRFVDYQTFINPEDIKDNAVIIAPYNVMDDKDLLSKCLYIKIAPISIGTGLNKATSVDELYEDLLNFLEKNLLDLADIQSIASFEAKKDEESLNIVAKQINKELIFYDKETINSLKGDFSPSEAQKYFNIKGVAEPAAILAAKQKTLFVSKHKYKNTTFAAAF
jgi:cobalt-precorrin 5A hydrolase